MRVPSVEDRRKIIIRLGERATKMHEIYHSVSAEMTELFYRGFTSGEIDVFERALTRILDNVEEFERS